MIKKIKSIFFILIICIFQYSFSQVNEAKKDTSKMYRDIQTYSKKNRFTKLIHGLIFEPIIIKKKKLKKIISRKRFRPFEGKIIRNITIVTLDPFGYSETDTTAHPEKFLERAGNSAHFKTRRLVIRNLLLYRKNKPLDSLLVKESERLIRKQKFIRAIQTNMQLSAPQSDSVDVYVRVLDTWSIIPKIQASDSKFYVDMNEKNFFGTGHQLEYNYKKQYSDGKNAQGVQYTIPNFRDTYIQSYLKYQIDLEDNYQKSFSIERPFFSAFAQWSAGIYIEQQFRKDSLADSKAVYALQNFKYNTQDYWIGNAIQLYKGNSEKDRTTNLITTARFLKINYIENPTIDYDSIRYYSNEKLYLIGIGISSKQYVEDKFIFNYQIIEDVPVGRAIGLTAGYRVKNNTESPYLGARISSAKYYQWGFLSSNLEYGTFWNHSHAEQSTLSFQTNYFTNLLEIRKWKFRQFIKSQISIGNNRLPTNADQLTLSDNETSSDFTNAKEYGTKRIILSFQTQSYSPKSIWGFRFNPYVNSSFRMLGNGKTDFKKSKVYPQFALGLIIKNDYLVFNSFQISLAFYPSLPGSGDNIFKTNSINSEDFGFQNLDLYKPNIVDYK